jgi:hypothetical protein
MKSLLPLVALFLLALTNAYGTTYARYFSASWTFVVCIMATAAFVFAWTRRSMAKLRDDISIVGYRASAGSVSIFISVVCAHLLYCVGAILTGLTGERSAPTAVVISTFDALRCDTKATVELADGRVVTYCAGVKLQRGEKVRVRLRTSPFGWYAQRG